MPPVSPPAKYPLVEVPETPAKLALAWLRFAVVWAAVVSFEYVNLSAVATYWNPVNLPPAK